MFREIWKYHSMVAYVNAFQTVRVEKGYMCELLNLAKLQYVPNQAEKVHLADSAHVPKCRGPYSIFLMEREDEACWECELIKEVQSFTPGVPKFFPVECKNLIWGEGRGPKC